MTEGHHRQFQGAGSYYNKRPAPKYIDPALRTPRANLFLAASAAITSLGAVLLLLCR